MKALARQGVAREPGGRATPADRIAEWIKMSGDEDCGVSIDCYHPECDPYAHGSIAYYGGLAEMYGMPNFDTDQLMELFVFIQQHVAGHLG